MRQRLFLGFCVIAWVAIAAWIPHASAYEFFDGTTPSACAPCHPALANFGPGHAAHAEPTGNDCGLCHNGGLSGRNGPPLSNCVICHGRALDAGGDGLSAGVGRGLRQHHQNAKVADCGACHSDATGPAGVGEDVAPDFYPGVGAVPLDPCDGSEEEFPSNTVSLDNDGDLSTDAADFDCAPPMTTTTAPPTTTTTLPPGALDVGITGKKLIIIDKLASDATKAKVVYVAKDPAAQKGMTNDPMQISATVRYQVTTFNASGGADMPSGANWLVNKETVAKYVNKDAPGGSGAVKVGVIKPDKLLKQLQERGGLVHIQRQIVESKVLDALALYARVEEGSP